VTNALAYNTPFKSLIVYASVYITLGAIVIKLFLLAREC